MSEERQAELERIGALVVSLRESKGWSQETLAHEAGVSVSTVSRLERGVGKTEPRKVVKIAKALDVPPAVLRPAAPDVETQLDRIEQAVKRLDGKVSDLDEQVRLLRTETAARDAEVLQRLDGGPPPTRLSRNPPQ